MAGAGGESGYVYRVTGGKYIFMHRLIMNAPPGKVVDHFNANRQDNRRANLRLCSQAQNIRGRRKFRGTSQFKGVSWNKRIRKWVASIFCDGKYIWLGHFGDEVEAARAYDKAARELFGEYARLNFPNRGNIVLSERTHRASYPGEGEPDRDPPSASVDFPTPRCRHACALHRHGTGCRSAFSVVSTGGRRPERRDLAANEEHDSCGGRCLDCATLRSA